MSAPKDSSSSEPLYVRVMGQDGQLIQFKTKRYIPFRKLMAAYCDRMKLSLQNVRFMFDDHRIGEAETPSSVGMEDNDTIDVFSQQSGGDATRA